MKSSVLLFVGLFISSISFSQKQDVQVYEKKEGDKVIVIARNTGTVDYAVKINITSEGMDVTPSTVVEASIPAGHMKEMATITPRPASTWSYSYDVTITQTITKPATKTVPSNTSPTATPKQPNATTSTQPAQKSVVTTPSLSNANIILYSKPGCGRCTMARNRLTSLGIEFLEVNTHSDSPEAPNMWAQMRSQGFAGGSVTMPVIRVDGKYHYDIKDLEGFISKLKT